MSRWLFPWSGSIKKRACRYLLQHYLGHFLQERLSLDQLGLDLYNGSGVIKDINLDVWAVNELLESLGAPLEIVDGFVSSIKVTIPWQALLTDHCTLEVSGLQITCRPNHMTGEEYWWSSSMTSSMQLAQECLKDPPEASEEPPAPLEGLEMFAQTIETVLRRIKVTFLDTIVRIEHQPLDLETGVALEVHIKRQTAVPVDIHQPPAFLHKILQLSSVQLFYDSTDSATAGEGEEEEGDEDDNDEDQKEAKPLVPPVSQPLLIGSCSGFIETTVKIKQNDMLPGPKLELDGKVGCVHMLLSPDQITHLTDLLAALCIDTEMFYSMGPAGMSSSVTSVRSGSELSDSDMESSTHSLASLTQPSVLSAQVRRSRSSQAEQLKPDALLRLTLGGVTLTLLQEDPPTRLDGSSSLAQVSQVFFKELASFKDSMFSDRDFHHLRGSFSKACPHSHLSSELFSSFSLISPHAVLRLRFPIPDLRPLSKRRPPTQRAVRQETLVLELTELELKHQEAISVRVRGGEAQGPAASLGGMNLGLVRDLGAAFFESHCELQDNTSSPFSSNRTMFETEEMVIPADPEEMRQFQVQCIAHCHCAVDISLPLAYILLPSKQAFQSIYNRINNDLLMWEPPPPPPPSDHSPAHGCHDEFQLCKSAFRLGETEHREMILKSVKFDGKWNYKTPFSPPFVLTAVVKTTPIPQRLEMPNFTAPKHLDPTIYPTEVGVSSVSGREGEPQMLSTAIKITLDLQRNVKEFLVALRLQGATMRHYMTQTNQSWHEQLVDFLDVIDDPILGYTAPAVITVLHTHLATCAVDYRPLYLPLRVLFTAESFSLSSNIIVDTATFHLRFILDDSALYLSDKCESDTVDLRRDYVCVLDIDLLELAITTWKGSDTGKLPLFELRCSNNVVHLHTCADSCAALVNLLQYLVSQGDLHPPPRHASPTEIAGQKLPVRAEPQSDDSELDGLVATATEALAETMSDEGSEGSTDNDDFCILEAPGMDGEPVVTVLAQGPIRVKDSHFSRPRGSSDLLRAPSRFPVPQSRVVLREISVVWHLYGGKDFGGKPIGRSVPAGVRGSPSRSVASSRPQNSWRWAGGSGRQHTLLMEIQLTKVSFQHESYLVVVAGQDGDGSVQPLSRQVFIVQELEVRDRLASSQINKFLYLYTSESMPRRAHSNMLTVKALQVCPESGLGGPECCLRVSLLPLRLNIDQDALFFLKDFFSNLASSVNPYLPVDPASEVKADPSQKVSEELESAGGLGPDLTASVETTYSEQSSSSAGSSSSSDQPIYFREFRFTSEVPIWLDYHGKHVVIEQGTFAGILIGLAQLNCSELKLKRLCCRHGLLGVDKVIQYAVTEWLTDIRKNQLPGILGGVGPMHSVVQLFHGVRDLFWLPIEQYRKDGRIIRGLQRGAASFGTSTASAALELSNRLVQAIQATAETVYDILSPTPPLNRFAITEGRAPTSRPRRAAQPADLREGVAKAYDTVREGVIDTAQTLCDVASRGHEQKGLPGAVGGVLRQIPPTVVRPLIVASEATSNLLGGMRNQIKPDARKEDFLKWRTEDGQE
uniref:Autophagy related 2A n=1 Tax=Sphaeramia orbicularis TaxID=375764 RepID=A0A673AS59_9TELE